MTPSSLKIYKVMLKLDGAVVDKCNLYGCDQESWKHPPSGRLFKTIARKYYFEPCVIHVKNWEETYGYGIVEIKEEGDYER